MLLPWHLASATITEPNGPDLLARDGDAYVIEESRIVDVEGEDEFLSEACLNSADTAAATYSQSIVGTPHGNWIGIDSELGPVVLSLCLEAPNGDSELLGVLRSAEGIQVLRVEARSRGGGGGGGRLLESKEALKAARRQLGTRLEGVKWRALPEDHAALCELDRALSNAQLKIGVVPILSGQRFEEEFLRNDATSSEYEAFLKLLGDRITLRGWTGWAGQLDTREDRHGRESVFGRLEHLEIMFHVTHLLPLDADPPHLARKRFIGNNIATVLFLEPGAGPVAPAAFASSVQQVFVALQPIMECEAGRGERCTRWRVQVAHRAGLPFAEPRPLASVPASPAGVRWLLLKLVNAERAAYRAPPLLGMQHELRLSLLQAFARRATDALPVAGSSLVLQPPAPASPPVARLLQRSVSAPRLKSAEVTVRARPAAQHPSPRRAPTLAPDAPPLPSAAPQQPPGPIHTALLGAGAADCLGLDEGDLSVLAGRASAQVFEPEEVLLEEARHASGAQLLLLRQGEARLLLLLPRSAEAGGRAQEMLRCGPGTLLGDATLLAPPGHACYGVWVATRRTHLLRIDPARLLALLEMHPRLAARLFLHLARQLARRLLALPPPPPSPPPLDSPRLPRPTPTAPVAPSPRKRGDSNVATGSPLDGGSPPPLRRSSVAATPPPLPDTTFPPITIPSPRRVDSAGKLSSSSSSSSRTSPDLQRGAGRRGMMLSSSLQELPRRGSDAAAEEAGPEWQVLREFACSKRGLVSSSSAGRLCVCSAGLWYQAERSRKCEVVLAWREITRFSPGRLPTRMTVLHGPGGRKKLKLALSSENARDEALALCSALAHLAGQLTPAETAPVASPLLRTLLAFVGGGNATAPPAPAKVFTSEEWSVLRRGNPKLLLPRGSAVLEAGQAATESLFVLGRGSCRVESASGATLACLEADDMFGEVSLLLRAPTYSATVRAERDDTEVLVIAPADLAQLAQERPGDFAVRFYLYMSLLLAQRVARRERALALRFPVQPALLRALLASK